MIRFAQVAKRYPDGTTAVDGLSFEVAEGELVTLVGPSGCGKTTIVMRPDMPPGRTACGPAAARADAAPTATFSGRQGAYYQNRAGRTGSSVTRAA